MSETERNSIAEELFRHNQQHIHLQDTVFLSKVGKPVRTDPVIFCGPQKVCFWFILFDSIIKLYHRCQHLEVLELANVDCTPNDLELAILEETREGHEPFRNLKKLIISECETFSMGDIARLLFACQDSLEEFRMDPTFCTSALLRVLNASGVKFDRMESLHVGYCGHDSLPWDMPYDAFCRCV